MSPVLQLPFWSKYVLIRSKVCLGKSTQEYNNCEGDLLMHENDVSSLQALCSIPCLPRSIVSPLKQTSFHEGHGLYVTLSRVLERLWAVSLDASERQPTSVKLLQYATSPTFNSPSEANNFQEGQGLVYRDSASLTTVVDKSLHAIERSLPLQAFCGMPCPPLSRASPLERTAPPSPDWKGCWGRAQQ
jgi:hypothetical protein